MNEAYRSDEELVQRIRRGEKEAFETLYRAYFFDLCEFTYRYVRLPAVCEEIVQDLFLNIWRRRDNLSPKGSIRSYLYKSARNGALDYLKHLEVQREYLKNYKLEKQLEWELLKLESAAGILEEEEGVELSEAVRSAIASLPDQRRTIFLLSREDGLTYREIAEVLDISVKTVETQMGRALATLRTLLAEYFL